MAVKNCLLTLSCESTRGKPSQLPVAGRKPKHQPSSLIVMSTSNYIIALVIASLPLMAAETKKLSDRLQSTSVCPFEYAGQMLVTYIDATLEPSFGQRGAHGFVSSDSDPPEPPVVVSLRDRSPGLHPVTAHEVGHVLGVKHPGVITHLLMTDGNIFTGMTYNKTHRDSKRIREDDFNTMKGRAAFYVPLQ